MTLALSLSDNLDGTGGVATVSGSSGASVSVYCASYTNVQQALAWTLAGTRTGDGVVPVNPGKGYYFWSAQTPAPALSNIVNQNLSDGAQACHYRCVLAYVQQIQLLALPGLPPENVISGWWPPGEKPPLYPLPAVAVMPMGREGQPGILNGQDDIEYPVFVWFEENSFNDFQGRLAERLLWRHRIFAAFRHQRLPGVREIVTTDVVPDEICKRLEWFKNMRFVGGLLFKPRSRELRGFNVT